MLFGLRFSARKNDDIALKRSSILQRDSPILDVFDSTMSLDKDAHFIQRCGHSTYDAGPTFPDHGQSSLLEGRIPLIKPLYA